MAAIEIGVEIDSFRRSAKEALRQASALGLRPVQLSAATGDVSPEALGDTGRRHLRRYVDGLGLTLAGLGADLGGRRFADSAHSDERLDRTRRILELASELRVPLVTARVGALRSGDDPRTELVAAALEQVADHADRTGVVFAIETAESTPGLLQAVLKRIDCPYVRAAYDPAALLMEGDDPVAGVQPLADQVVFSFARDAVQGSAERPGCETPLGTGDIDFAACLAALEEAGYHGPQILRSTSSEDPVRDIAAAKEHLERILRA